MDLDNLTAPADLPDSYAELSEHEVEWRNKQPFLATRGYMLRPRYHPDWKPSCLSTLHTLSTTEDSISLPARLNLIDAVRIQDNRMVCIKRVSTDSTESTISSRFSRTKLRDEPGNHCVPVLDLFPDDEDPTTSYMVMPFMRYLLNNPPFDLVNDVVEMTDQLLEGLAFMHLHNVAHRNCGLQNVMMDGSALYPQGSHPVLFDYTRDLGRKAPTLSRLLEPVKYYFVDFERAIHCPPGAPRLVRGDEGAHVMVPEPTEDFDYDPFKADVFLLGNVFQRDILPKYSNVEFLRPLVRAMTEVDPRYRPSAAATLERWRSIRGRVSWIHRLCRLRRCNEDTDGSLRATVLDLWSFLKIGIMISPRFSRLMLRVFRLCRSVLQSFKLLRFATSWTPSIWPTGQHPVANKLHSIETRLRRTEEKLILLERHNHKSSSYRGPPPPKLAALRSEHRRWSSFLSTESSIFPLTGCVAFRIAARHKTLMTQYQPSQKPSWFETLAGTNALANAVNLLEQLCWILEESIPERSIIEPVVATAHLPPSTLSVRPHQEDMESYASFYTFIITEEFSTAPPPRMETRVFVDPFEAARKVRWDGPYTPHLCSVGAASFYIIPSRTGSGAQTMYLAH